MELAEQVQATAAKRRQVSALEAQVKKLKEEIAHEDADILEMMTDANFKNFTLQDGTQVYMRRLFGGKVKDGKMEEVVRALEELGMRSLVSVNSNTLKGFVGEQIKLAGEEAAGLAPDQLTKFLPESLRDCIEISDVVKVQWKGL